jgi:hypothetical protein
LAVLGSALAGPSGGSPKGTTNPLEPAIDAIAVAICPDSRSVRPVSGAWPVLALLVFTNGRRGVGQVMRRFRPFHGPGLSEVSRAAGVYDKARLVRLFERMLGQLEGGLKMTVVRLMAEGLRVATEVESSATCENS